MAGRNPFDLDAIRIDPSDPALVPVERVTPTKVRRRRQHFIQVPFEWLERLNGASGQAHQVALHLLYLHWKGEGQPIKLANGMMATDGIPPESKRRALRELQRRGLIKVEWRFKKSPIVQVLVGG
jgi:hypothetical protein